MAIVNKRIAMTLYSDSEDAYSHQVRIALAEKGVNVNIMDTQHDVSSEEIAELNPYGHVPILLDRDLVLYQARIILEYLDERFPHPPLLPVYPVARARYRLMMHRIENDWYSLVKDITSGTDKQAEKARKELAESIIALDEVFAQTPYFLSDEFTLVDCAIAPLLWRLPQLGIQIPKSAKGIQQYCDRVFAREGFQQSLTDVERELRVA